MSTVDSSGSQNKHVGDQTPGLQLGSQQDVSASSLMVAALPGVLVALVMPRGPATTGQALFVMLLSLVVGMIAGAAMRSRWAMMLAPLAHVVALERARVNVVGPAVDAS